MVAIKVLDETTGIYEQQRGKKKRCSACGHLLQEGEMVVKEKLKKEGVYPVRGHMCWVSYRLFHIACFAATKKDAGGQSPAEGG